jgi:hypothetical protein
MQDDSIDAPAQLVPVTGTTGLKNIIDILEI